MASFGEDGESGGCSDGSSWQLLHKSGQIVSFPKSLNISVKDYFVTSLVPLLSKDIVTNQSLHAFSVRVMVKSWNPSVQSSSSKMKVGSKMTFL